MNLRVGHGAVVLAVLLASACGDGDDGPATDAGASSTGGTQGNTTSGNTGNDGGATTGNNGNSSNGNGSTTGTTGGDNTGNTGTTGNTGNTGSTGNTGNTGSTGNTTGGTTGGAACDASKAPSVGKLGYEVVESGLARLVYAAQPPGSTDWYLVEQAGKIRVLSGGELKPTAFLDVSSEISLGGLEDERGLLGLAFPPDYAASGKAYVALTTSGNKDIVYEFTRSTVDPFVVDEASKKMILDLPASAGNHNGGIVRFGKDGKLYVGTGDGGGSCSNNQGDAPQDVNQLFGKILRLDPSKAAPYAADGNPFATGGDARVYHYGLRNPYRFNFDSVTGDLYIGDVGQDDFEEVSFAAMGTSGLNFGWPAFEANAAVSTTCGASFDPRMGSTHTPPIFQADRKGSNADPNFGDWKSVIGGVVYRGSALPGFNGIYVFGDYAGERMAALCRNGSATSAVTPFGKTCDVNLPNQGCLVPKGGAAAITELMAIVEGNDGEIYLVADHNALLKVVPN
jgi:glucose/arabinose dehydrogenase